MRAVRTTSRRLLSTAPPTGTARTNVSRALIAAAVAAPVGFVAYKWQTDDEFKARINDISTGEAFKAKPKPSEPQIVPAVQEAPVPKVEQPAKQPAEQHSVPSDDIYISVAELDDIEKILVPATSATYSKEEVADVKKKIADAEEKAQAEAAKEAAKTVPEVVAEATNPVASVAENQPVETKVEHHTRKAVEALRDAAKRVETEATEATTVELEKAKDTLRSDIEKVLAKDLGTLSVEGLRERVVQLTLELKDRNRWEALRLHEVVSKTIEDISRKYLSVMKEQEQAYENLLRAELSNATMEATVVTEERLSKSLQDRLARQKQALAMEMEMNIERAKEEQRRVADAERKSRTAVLHEMEKKLLEVEDLIREKERSRVELIRSKRASLAALRFVEVVLLNKAKPEQVENSLSELRLATAGDATVTEALDSLPHRVFASGVPSLLRLSKTFEKDVKPDVLRSSLAPENASLMQQALARATTALMITGKPSASPMPDEDTVESRLTRVQALLDKENLVGAVQEFQELPQQAIDRSVSARDWLSQAQDRLKVEATIRLLTARFESKE